ncbi:hypothetical protein [Paludibacterium yongneupense]|uniref:hypothetical protein n=1 Tax=Paludibacterium yongneupense TaxID=400061 RepID=UPI00048AB8BB|nr:hypothetical protein [Paludibacterium yongneupense]
MTDDRDLRSPALRDAHTELARAAFTGCVDRFGTAPRQAAGARYESGFAYYTRASFGALAYLELEALLYDEQGDAGRGRYLGRGGGAVVGSGIMAGTSWLMRPLSEMNGLVASFEANAFPFALNINWWDDSGALGSFVGGGLSIGAGIAGGSGMFTAPAPR